MAQKGACHQLEAVKMGNSHSVILFFSSDASFQESACFYAPNCFKVVVFVYCSKFTVIICGKVCIVEAF